MQNPGPGEIVGVVANVRHTGLAEAMRPVVYYTTGQLPSRMVHFLVRSSGSGLAGVTQPVTRAIHSLDPTLAVADVRPLEAVLAESVARQRFTAVLLSVFSGFALVLAVFGLYGVLSYIVAQRTSEIGVRMALGARPGDILQLMMREGMRLVGAGLVLGIGGSVLLVRFVRTLLVDITPQDPVAWAAVPILLAIASLIALTGPALRASRLQPVIALRTE
jgi:putative ABC transport system permease protein